MPHNASIEGSVGGVKCEVGMDMDGRFGLDRFGNLTPFGLYFLLGCFARPYLNPFSLFSISHALTGSKLVPHMGALTNVRAEAKQIKEY